jgi:hypothetical protein
VLGGQSEADSRVTGCWIIKAASAKSAFEIYIQTVLTIQNVPEGKVNILGGHSIGHSKQAEDSPLLEAVAKEMAVGNTTG